MTFMSTRMHVRMALALAVSLLAAPLARAQARELRIAVASHARSLDVNEANIGPLRAGLGDGKLDTSLNPRRLFTDEGRAEHTYGSLRIDGDSGELLILFHDVAGCERPGARLQLRPR